MDDSCALGVRTLKWACARTAPGAQEGGTRGGRGSSAPAGMPEPGAFPVSRRAGAPGGLGFVQTGFVGLLREKIAPVLGCERSALVAGSLARLAAGMPLRAAFREFAAGKAESGLLDCPKAPPAGCASLQPRGRTGELRQCPAVPGSHGGAAAAVEPGAAAESPEGSPVRAWPELLFQSNTADLRKDWGSAVFHRN